MNYKPLLVIPLIAALAACGGSNGGGSTTSSLGTVSLFVTDNLTLDYSEVWVNVQSISATDANGQTVTLFQDATGQIYNLSQLANIGALVDVQAVAPGTYTSFDIVMGNTITLVDNVGTFTDATFDQTGQPTYSLNVTGALTVDANQNTSLALDFDLAQFTYDAGTNTVTPVVVQKATTDLNQTVSTIFGEVENVISSSQFTLDPEGNGQHLTVTLHANASVTNTGTGDVTSDTSGLSNDLHVIVAGDYDPATLTITATSVEYGSAASLSHEVEGTITAVNGGILTIDLDEANFMPGSNSVDIDVSNAAFSHGSLANLNAGQKVEIKGSWDGTTFVAVAVEIEGYSSNGSSDSYDDDYAEIKGLITANDNGVLTLTVQEFEDVSGINVGDSVSIDSSNSQFKYGTSSCLVANGVIEAKGVMTATDSMNANMIEIESGC